MAKYQTSKDRSIMTTDGLQVRLQDGIQIAAGGMQVRSDGLQMVARPQQGSQIPGYGCQTSAQTTSQGTFAPVSGPKIPPMKK